MIKNIVVSGGGFRAVVFLGCFKYLEEIGALDHVHTLVGSSAGSVMCFMMALGYTYAEAHDALTSIVVNAPLAEDIIPDPFVVLETYGLSSGENMLAMFQKLLKAKHAKLDDITFMEMAKVTGKNLVVCVTNLTRQETQYCSLDTTPNLSVLTALRMSCSVPLLLSPVIHDDEMYVDGCLYNMLPADYLKKESFREHNTLGLLLQPGQKKITNLGTYVQAMLGSMWRQLYMQRIAQAPIPNICTIDMPTDDDSTDILSMSIATERFARYVELGYESMRQFIVLRPS
jgi:predicted acylesterase/phospholipase RssA